MVRSMKEVCVKDKIYLIDVDNNTERTSVAEYNAWTKSLRMFSRSFEPLREYIPYNTA